MSCADEVGDQLPALDVDEWIDVVHDLAGEPGNADAAIEARCAEPQHAAAAVGLHLSPETHVMPAPRAVPGEALEREVLRTPAGDEVSAHGRRRIGAAKKDAAGVFQSAPERDAIRLRPAGRRHRRDHLCACSHDRDVDRIGGNPLRRVAHPRQGHRRRQVGAASPDRRHHAVRDRRVCGKEENEKSDRSGESADQGLPTFSSRPRAS